MLVTPTGGQNFSVLEPAAVTGNPGAFRLRKQLVLASAIVIFAYVSICISDIAANIDILAQVVTGLSAAMALLGMSWALGARLRRLVRRIALSWPSTALLLAPALVFLSMLVDFTGYAITKSIYTQRVLALALDPNEPTISNLRDVALTMPNRKEAYVLVEYQAAQVQSTVGGIEGRMRHREIFREFLGLTDAFDNNTLMNPDQVTAELELFCEYPDLTPYAPVKFTNLFRVLLGGDAQRTEESAGCSIALDRFRRSLLPLFEDCSTQTSDGQLDHYNRLAEAFQDPSTLLRLEILNSLRSAFTAESEDSSVCQRFVALGNNSTQTEADACAGSLSTAAMENLSALERLDGATNHHEYQFALSAWAYQDLLHCSYTTSLNLDGSGFGQNVLDRVGRLVMLRNRLAEAEQSVGRWPAPPETLAINMALLAQTHNGRYACAAIPEAHLVNCFGSRAVFLEELEPRLTGIDVANLSTLWWWSRGSLEEVYNENDFSRFQKRLKLL